MSDSTGFLSDHNELIMTRYAKVDALRKRGVNPYPRRVPTGDLAADVLARAERLLAEESPVTVLGRVMTIRSFGKAAFFHLRDRSGQIQVYVKKSVVGDELYELFTEFIDGGDIVSVTGKLFTTKTGEVTIEASTLTLSSKAVRQLPEKWSGLKDVELRYRQRYVDLIANPEVAETFRTRSRIIAALRRWLDDQGFMEVETPMMQPLYGGASARPFVTHHNTLDMELFLRIAPELYLKRLVVGGLDRVYEINRNFRNEGISIQHNPEFTMLELYAGGWDASVMMDFVEELYRETARAVLGTTVLEVGGTEVELAERFPRLTMTGALKEHLGIELDWDMDAAAAKAAAGSHGIPADKKTTADMILFLFEEHVEKQLIRPTFIHEFPKSISPLAKSVDGRPEVADRFELYGRGMELANAYSELNDPREQYQRFEEQSARRTAGDEEAVGTIDEDYVRALEHGMVNTSGLGVGIDRLVMLLTNSTSIRDVILFPLLRPHKGAPAETEAADE